MSNPRIKICGITRQGETGILNRCNVDYAGFVFYEKSKRNVDIETVRSVGKALDPAIRKVAVMVSPGAEFVAGIQEDFDILQIHKQLDEAVLEVAKRPVWLAINISNSDEVDEKLRWLSMLPDELEQKIEAIVVDAPNFGSGTTFDWDSGIEVRDAIKKLDKSFVLAGGLRPQNVSEGIKIFRPDIVDVSSGVEGDSGKDDRLVEDFVNNVRTTEV